MKFFAIGQLIMSLSVSLLAEEVRAQQPNKAAWPQRVLITNDNGIEDMRTIELARAFARIAETYVVAVSTDLRTLCRPLVAGVSTSSGET